MDVPLELTFHNVEPSEAVEARVRERVEKLEKFYGRLTSCRVAIEAPHAYTDGQKMYEVRVDMTVPGKRELVTRAPHHREKYRDPDVYTILNEAFDNAERQLRKFKERRRDEPVHEEVPMVGIVTELRPAEDIGFLRTVNGSNLWFHRNAVLNNGWDELEIGTSVAYLEDVGEGGPQAAKVWISTGHNTST